VGWSVIGSTAFEASPTQLIIRAEQVEWNTKSFANYLKFISY